MGVICGAWTVPGVKQAADHASDIAGCFGPPDHDVMIRILSERIRDNRFLRLVRMSVVT